MEPKPIDSRHLLDVDRQRRVVDMEGFAERLRALREHKENPEDTDYDVTHDEEGRHGRKETSKQPTEDTQHGKSSDEEAKPDRSNAPKDKSAPANGQKGAHLDIEA